MLRLLIILVALFASTAARAETFGYYDDVRLHVESTEAKRVAATDQADLAAKNREINAANEAAEKAKPGDRPALQQKAVELVKMDQADYDKAHKDAAAKLRAHLVGVVVRLKAERHLTEVLPVLPVDAPPKLDLTDELIRRWNAADIEATAAELARTKAELDAIKKSKTQETNVTKGPRS